MLGQRIIESYGDLENDNFLQAEPTTSLTIRRIKSAGLRIVTESEPVSSDALRDNTNTLQPPNHHRNSYLSIRTPDTSHTFGIPNPTMLSPDSATSRLHTPPSTLSSAPAELLASRRLSRYSRAESALQSAVEASSAEVSPHELQIQVLERATAVLSEQARDAQACAERLRACLADQELSPEEFKSLQRARWLEEHKSSSRQAQSAHTRELLVKLSSPVEEEPPLVESPQGMTRREANFARFLQHSPTRIAFPPTRSPTISPTLYHRKTLSQARPMRLRASAMDLALRSPLRTHTRTRSLDGGHSRSNSEMTEATLVSQGSSGQTTVAQGSIPEPKLSYSLSPLPPAYEGEGTVSIEKWAVRRTRDELLAEVGDVTLPDYAVDLLEDLAASTIDISLQEIDDAEVNALSIHVEPTSNIAFTSPVDSELVPSTPLRFAERLDSPTDTPVSPARSLPTPDTRRRSAVPTKSSFRNSLAVPRFSSLRLSPRPLVTVPEGSDVDPQSRPHSSLSGRWVLESSSALHEPMDDAHPLSESRRFSVVSFRRLERSDTRARSGILARVKRRFSTLGLGQ